MKGNKLPFVAALLVLAVASNVHAGTEGRVTADYVHEDEGNYSTVIAVGINTTQPVLISSKAANAGLNIAAWRSRTIINTSNGQLLLLPNNTQYTKFCSTCGVVLGTGSVSGLGDIYTTNRQGEIWGIWGPNATTGGAAGEESYWNDSKK